MVQWWGARSMAVNGKNKHLDHLEDRIILDGNAGAKEAIEILKLMGDFLSGTPGPGIAVTTKWDGAPAIVCGTDPSDGQFFVGTKSVFNAANPKIYKTQTEIQRNESGGLAAKLSSALQYLPAAQIKGVLQGDLMFTNDKKRETIDGVDYITFRPNTITYAANPKTNLGRKINAAQIGIVFHTKYTGDSLPTMTASFDVGNDFKTGGNVWAEKAQFQDIGKVAAMNLAERQKYDAAIRKAEGSITQASDIFNKIKADDKTLGLQPELLKFVNKKIRAGHVPSVERTYAEFLHHLGGEYAKNIEGLKTLEGQANKAFKFVDALFFVDDNERQFKMFLATWMNIVSAKMMLVDKMKRVQSLNLFVDMGTHYQATTPEGFVAITGGKATKLIDRLEFSKLNFTIPKVWDK